MYGEPPPSYQNHKKYFPVTKLDFAEDAHIYENIDESANITAKQRKGRFKSLNTKEPTNMSNVKTSKIKPRTNSFQSKNFKRESCSSNSICEVISLNAPVSENLELKSSEK